MSTAKGLYESTVTIASGQGTSTPANTGGAPLAGFYILSTFTGASVTFTASQTGDGTYYPVRDRFGNVITVTVNTSVPSYYSLQDALPFGADFIRVVSASNEAADRTIVLKFQQVID